MLVRLFSDLHIEFGHFSPPVLENEKDMVLILAGDIGVAESPRTIGPFLHEMASRHRDVIYIAGNHEHYHTSFLRTLEKMREAVGMWSTYLQTTPNAVGIPSNVHIIQNQVVMVDEVAFIGSTLWTDFRKHNAHAMFAARESMNDYKYIRTGVPGDAYKRRLQPIDTYRDHQISKPWIFEQIKQHKELGHKVFVISHHAPSEQSIDVQYRNSRDDILNPSYASELGYEIADSQPNFWVHGHTHVSFDYTIGETRVVCNPRGYFGVDLNDNFNPFLLIEV